MPTLHWVGKNKVVNHHHDVPFRLLDKQYTFKAKEGTPANSENNRIIHGDNLEALKSLLPEFEGKVNCIYIDPPYNTGNESWIYNDNVNDPKIKKWLGQVVGKEGEDLSRHDKWLCMMYPRLKLLHRLLAKNGVLFLQLNDDELHYAKVLMDEIFGRDSYINEVCVKMKLTAGASGGGEDKRLKKNIENILIYTRDRTGEGGFDKFNDVYDEENLFDIIDDMESEGKSWKYTSVLLSKGDFVEERVVLDGAGDEIKVKKYKSVKRTTVNSLVKSGVEREDAYLDNFNWIFSDTNAQTSIRTRIMDEFVSLEDDELLIAEYVPRSGRAKGTLVQHYYISPTIRRVIWLKDTAVKRGKGIVKLEKAGTYWDGFPLNNLTKEGGIQFPSGKKPVLLIEKILRLATTKNSIILDSFAGSGTTAHAVLNLNAQDGGNRRFILSEMMDYAETITAERIRRVIDGYSEGNKIVAGLGGSFDFYKVGAALFKEDKSLNEEVGAEAIRSYVAYTENIPTGQRLGTENPVSPYALGSTNTALFIFYYEEDRVTTLDIDFLGQLKVKNLQSRPEQFVIYADKCALDKDFLCKHGITFKRIPRDITRF
ncbi:site-specific DNA-methyltransferase [Pseudomonas sp. LjRoot71]|uniref:site-specific DNA-methyltransferase n=1 Tax=Pseudomonas sp. LjRoot71 TaxID=3342336 RepID=UPI003ED0A9C6